MNNTSSARIKPIQALLDLIIFLTVMYLVRTVYIDSIGFWGNALFRSVSTVGTATVLLYVRKQSWKNLGLTKPDNLWRMLIIAAITMGATVGTMIIFEVLKDIINPLSEESNSSGIDAKDIQDGIMYSITIMTFVWIESFLEELQDRGFSLNRLESLFSKSQLTTILAVLMQAAIFGFRHSYDLSARSISTGLIGLVFGIVYVLSKRNLWPLIIAHIVLNSISMMDRL